MAHELGYVVGVESSLTQSCAVSRTQVVPDTSNFTKAQRQNMQPLFAGRDEIITLLARSDPASADRLSDLYVAYRKIMNG